MNLITFLLLSHLLMNRSFFTLILFLCLFVFSSVRCQKRSRSSPQSQRWSTLSSSSGGIPGATGGSSSSPSSDGQVHLHVGMQVFLSSANDMAIIRYLGTADFAPGLWLGLELRSPKGKNDGSVDGRRYFSCRTGYGVLVRPSRVTYRGINGSRLVNENN